jgi:hypothetical protein
MILEHDLDVQDIGKRAKPHFFDLADFVIREKTIFFSGGNAGFDLRLDPGCLGRIETLDRQ